MYVGSLVAAFAITALRMNIQQRKAEAATPYVRVVRVTEDTTDPSVWGRNWPRQYDPYKRTALTTRTRFGGHGGSESLPVQKAEIYPWLTTIYQGYAFALDYQERWGHAYMLVDQEQTERHSVPQSGSCLHCHAVSEKELLSRVDGIQERNYELVQNAGEAVEDLIFAIVQAKEEQTSV